MGKEVGGMREKLEGVSNGGGGVSFEWLGRLGRVFFFVVSSVL